ncbi:hypothetical protein [Burkholderia latens]|uniref:AbrB/MazE/SpoVT family DNA-binding domain-containing protein n=1 Tax=Burkholderia latens TaxID=488446 RepID=A0A6H9STY7_9BURK|nr:hypothetical protein [Burkholderia latens]KAB0642900.1 hypothetical protein F7R21_09990 [Burkholderia latens]
MKVHFGTKKVQKMGRVALTDALLRNAGIQEGDSVDLYFDATTKAIIIERTPIAGEPEAAPRIARVASKSQTS